MKLTKENKNKLYFAGAIIAILILIVILIKFWVYTAIAVGCFGGGYYLGRKKKKLKQTIE